MSKGIGASYVKRMSRYHRCTWIKNPRTRIEAVVDRSTYHDGAFQYKLPRYFRDRLYRMKFPYDVRIWNKKKCFYENKTVYRYASKNPLALQMQTEVRNRLLSEYNRRVEAFRCENPNLTRSEIDILLARSETASRLDRQKTIYSKMSRFYHYNRVKNSKL